MKPRVFVSSTYYDLKYIRNNLERFISQYGFEPVLFESGNVYFEHSKDLDTSCYNEVKLCHMMILIIGGRYGAPASEEKQQDFISNYEKNYISITRKEFREAVDKNIPIYIFIDKNVYSEYHTFNKNKKIITEQIKADKLSFNFAFVDNINIFDFIDEVRIKAILPFEKFDEIEDYLKHQWAGMFFNYLNVLISNNEKNRIISEVEELNNISERMNEMLDQIGKNILTTPGEYDDVVKRQNEKTINLYAGKILDNIEFDFEEFLSSNKQAIIFELTELIIDNVLNNEEFYEEDGMLNEISLLFIDDLLLLKKLNDDIRKIYEDIKIRNIDYSEIIKIYSNKVKPLFTSTDMQSLFKETLERKISSVLTSPF